MLMPLKRIFTIIILLNTIAGNLFAQNTTDSINAIKSDSVVINDKEHYPLKYKNFIVPAVFIGYGVASLTISPLKHLNFSTRDEILEDKPHRLSWDNYTQYMPAVLVYGLNAAGVKGKHNLKDRTIIYATSQLISAGFVLPLKHLVKEERPDGSNNLSFPSGHTATAFSSAQFMFREYKDTNIWLGLSGYSLAVFTAVYRAINNKHWVGDVVAGAGFGILSTELAYWLYPKINTLFSGKNKNTSTMVMPFLQNKSLGIGLVKNF